MGLSATFRNPREVDGLKFGVLADPFSLEDGRQRLFLLPDEIKCVPGPLELIRIHLMQLTSSGRLDDPLSFWLQ
jgi:hypothetical protein